jgi:lipoate synthase
VPRLIKRVQQPQDKLRLGQSAFSPMIARRMDPDVLTKSGIMLGLGETYGRR